MFCIGRDPVIMNLKIKISPNRSVYLDMTNESF